MEGRLTGRLLARALRDAAGRFARWTCALCLCSCAYQARVPRIDGAQIGATGGQAPGHYAALVQSNIWDMKFSFAGIACAPYSYEADVNPAWDDAMRKALSAALGQVDFVATLHPPASLTLPYDAQIGMIQSDASTRVEITPRTLGLQGFEAHAETRLKGALTIVFPDGTFDYEPIEGDGTGSSVGYLCSDVSPAIGKASTEALREIVRRAVMTTKQRLAR